MDISYDYICSNASDIPKEALEHLDSQLIKNLGSDIISLFPRFSNEFKLACAEIVEHWSAPKLALKKHLNRWLIFVVVQSEDRNMFFRLQPKFMDKEGEDFDEDHQMLPLGWKELYRWFNSFVITEQTHYVMNWWNTPFRYEARLELDDYEDGGGVTRKQTMQFASSIGCKRENLRCWLLTENEDALFINEEACDGRVYHVRGKDLETINELSNPTEMLDKYLANIISGKQPKEFSFVS